MYCSYTIMVIWSQSVADSVVKPSVRGINCEWKSEHNSRQQSMKILLLSGTCKLLLTMQSYNDHISISEILLLCMYMYADYKTAVLKSHHTNKHLNAISHFPSFGTLRLSNGPLKLEMSHWNKIEGAIWHIEKKVIPIPAMNVHSQIMSAWCHTLWLPTRTSYEPKLGWFPIMASFTALWYLFSKSFKSGFPGGVWVWVYWCLTSQSTIFQSYNYVTAHKSCAGGLKKKLDLWLGSQRHRQFVGFFNVPVQTPTTLFIRWFRHTAPFTDLVTFYDTLGIRIFLLLDQRNFKFLEVQWWFLSDIYRKSDILNPGNWWFQRGSDIVSNCIFVTFVSVFCLVEVVLGQKKKYVCLRSADRP